MTQRWQTLSTSLTSSIDLPMTLCGGQCFRWHSLSQGHYFVGVIGSRAYALRESSAGLTAIEFKRLRSNAPRRCGEEGLQRKKADEDDEVVLDRYLSLDVPLPALWHRWTCANPRKTHPLVGYLTEGCSNASQRTEPFVNIRHLRQDLHETLFSFICSQNNHVKRITAMADKLCSAYGNFICTVEMGEEKGGGTAMEATVTASGRKRARFSTLPTRSSSINLHTFPTVSQLKRAKEAELRDMGFGYRGKYITGCIKAIASYKSQGSGAGAQKTDGGNSKEDGGALHDALQQHYETTLAVPFYRDLLARKTIAEQRAMLLTLPGVGRKVADCVLLFALGHTDLVPVDTHMAQVAAEYLSPTLPAGTQATKKRRSERGPVAAASPAPVDWQMVVRQWRESATVKSTTAKKRVRTVARSTGAEVLPPLTDKHHDAIQEGFRDLFGSHAGWAHSILFYKRMR